MKEISQFAGFILLLVVTLGASFPYVTLNNTTNRLSDNGTAFTRNGVAIGGGAGTAMTVSNNIASGGLLSVDATKTNGIAPTAAHITNAWAIFDGDTNKAVSGAGTLVAFPAGGGSSPFTNIAGVVQYAPGQAATNVFSVVSGLADNATNVAAVVDTASAWTGDSKLFVFKNNSSTKSWIASGGGLGMGSLSSLATSDAVFISSDISASEPGTRIIHVDVTEDSNFTAQGFGSINATRYGATNYLTRLTIGSYNPDEDNEWYLDGGAGNQESRFRLVGATTLIDFRPTSTATTTAYSLDTSIPHTSGSLLQVSNAATNKASILYDGSLTTGGDTNRWILKSVTEGATTNIVVNINGKDYTFTAW